jgi:hypothetical protein
LLLPLLFLVLSLLLLFCAEEEPSLRGTGVVWRLYAAACHELVLPLLPLLPEVDVEPPGPVDNERCLPRCRSFVDVGECWFWNADEEEEAGGEEDKGGEEDEDGLDEANWFECVLEFKVALFEISEEDEEDEDEVEGEEEEQSVEVEVEEEVEVVEFNKVRAFSSLPAARRLNKYRRNGHTSSLPRAFNCELWIKWNSIQSQYSVISFMLLARATA